MSLLARAPAPAVAAGPFSCTNTAYLSTGNSSTTQLYAVNDAVIPFGLSAIGSPAALVYNGIGFNPVDDYLYGLSGNTLVKIDSAGNVTTVGTVSGLPNGGNNSGAFLQNGTFVTGSGNSLYFVNIATPAVTSSVSIGFSINDLAINPVDGNIYIAYQPGGGANDLIGVYTTTGTLIRTISQTTTNVNGNVGAQWFDSAGDFFIGSTGGQFYQASTVTGDIQLLSTNVAYSQIDGAACIDAAVVSSGTITVGPVGADATTGSYDGVVGASNNNDFTAMSFEPTSGALTNGGTVPGTPAGNTLGAVTPFVVPNSFTFTNGPVPGTTISFTAAAPSGWTAQICPSMPSPVATGACTAQSASLIAGYWSSVSAAGATATATYTLPTTVTSASGVVFYVRYAPPSGTTAFTRYDSLITGYAGIGNGNSTHDELYSGFVPLTKTVTTQTPGNCTAIPSAGACPGATLLYAIDYRNIMVGGASESAVPSALLITKPGTLVITDSGSTGGNTWATYSSGLNDALVAGANGTTTYGDTTSGSQITGGTVGSTAFSDVVGGSSFRLAAPGAGGTSQGTVYFRTVVK